MQTRNVYTLPIKEEDFVLAISHPKAHFAHFKYAIDFVLPEGTKIIAPLDGTVVDFKDNSKEGGPDPKFNDIKYLNYLTIKHKNREFSQYLHLKYKGIKVKVGDKVKKGQIIAISGNTGFTSAPHLHFMVFKNNNTNISWESLKIKFNKKIKIDREHKKIPNELKSMVRELKRSLE